MSASALSPQNAVAVIDGVDVDVVAAAVRACPGVDELYGGQPGGIATYLPGRRIDGVRVDRYAIEVQVRARWGAPALDIAAQIRGALAVIAAGRHVDVIIADVTDPAAPPECPGPLNVDTATTSERDLWTTNSSGGRGGASSSGPIIQTVAATPMSSSPA
jgi:hypothetical protein